MSGTNGNDTLPGTAGDDEFFGNLGNDVLLGLGGNDTLFGGAGDDALAGGTGRDQLYGNSGDDVISGGGGADLLDSGAGNDILDGGAGDDSLYGGTGFNIMSGGAGQDTAFFGGAYQDYNVTALGDNTYTVVYTGNDPQFASSNFVQEVEKFVFDGQVVIPCYAAGTLVETQRGNVAVEDLQIGDQVRTVSGRQGDFAPVTWLGWRRVDLLRHPRPEKVNPIRVRAGALGNNQPVRDLVVSPDHCLFVDGILVPARLLVDGQAVVREAGWSSVTYWHVELPQHDLMLAEGVAAESYLDRGNRNAFANAAVPAMHPDFEGTEPADASLYVCPKTTSANDPALLAARTAIAARWIEQPAARAA
ncbi:Hint domain-containing protein [Roseomonas sp. BN140053]|uniref:Hint domain-containing protein n=1 Tax=Roseomonas sp. BN140053 TaxID=3391898 RepID=UPI0039ECB16E